MIRIGGNARNTRLEDCTGRKGNPINAKAEKRVLEHGTVQGGVLTHPRATHPRSPRSGVRDPQSGRLNEKRKVCARGPWKRK